MSPAHQPSPGAPAPRSRSDSFVRMLELEKLCKMKRILRDHGSPTPTSDTPRAGFPSVTANPPPPRSRRTSDYPPLSHQTQIMKAVRRSAALPSLSLSIPPSSAQTMMRPEGSVEELSLSEERAKTVTFSEPEDEQLSDESSICQSPSWEQYGQKKKKKQRKKGIDQKITKDNEETTLKRKSNRLSKLPPNNPFTARSLTASDRSISAPELGVSIQSNQMKPSLASETPGTELRSTAKDKRKSKGFLSGFRLQHGNVAAVQKIVEARQGAVKGLEKGASEDEPLRSIQYETIPVQQSNISKSRKPPSIRSVISTSDQSLSSHERRGVGVRTSTGSGHGRSQSLLSSTLNKLRGPSYLYHQPPEDGCASDPSKYSDSIHDASAGPINSVDALNDQMGKVLKEGNVANEYPQQVFDFAFPPKLKRVNTEPGPDIAPRGREPRLRKVEFYSPEPTPVLRPSSSRRVQTEVPQISTRDAVMAMVAAQERQALAAHTSHNTRSNMTGNNVLLDASNVSKGYQERGREMDENRTESRSQKAEIHRSQNVYVTTANTLGISRLSERDGKVAASSDRDNTRDFGNGHIPKDEQVPVDTYVSAIRPTSHQTLSRPGRLEPNSCIMASGKFEVQHETGGQTPVGDLITFERDAPTALQQPLQPYREMDYFASFSESYLPPVLNLRSLADGKLVTPQVPFPEESDEDDEHDALNDHSRSSQVTQRVTESEGEQEPGHTINSTAKESSWPSGEQKPKDSPASFNHHSDSNVPTFERLSLSSEGSKTLVRVDVGSPSKGHSKESDPSRTTSERSSSSTCDDSPPSPSSATTPDSSRPQSRKGSAASQPGSSQTVLLESVPQSDCGASHRYLRGRLGERLEGIAPRRTRAEAYINGSDWIEPALGLISKQQPIPTAGRSEVVAIGPSIAAAPSLVSFADVLRQDLNDDHEQDVDHQRSVPSFPPRTHSALDLRSTMGSMPRSSRPQRLNLKPNEAISSVSLPSSPPADLTEMPRKSAMKMSRNNSTNGPESLSTASTGAAYLQEARRVAPVATTSSSRAVRPHFSQNNSSGSVKSTLSAGNRAEPLAKMLVECCNCHFFHDMPSRVYECMAKPDSVVEDKSLGVSAAITTMVRCPWCAHGMTTQCCSGYAAVVYLKEKLHGK
ncbi:hypothetical protein F5Y03DRAFT_381050 [Xylaria venustula]|nr:hypothetical protein F5Y03DRAFT_381050 [Xylaria venustula]